MNKPAIFRDEKETTPSNPSYLSKDRRIFAAAWRRSFALRIITATPAPTRAACFVAAAIRSVRRNPK